MDAISLTAAPANASEIALEEDADLEERRQAQGPGLPHHHHRLNHILLYVTADCRLAKSAMINVACEPCDVAPTGTATEPVPYYAAVFAMRAPAPPTANTNLHFTRDPNGEWRCGARYGRRG